MKLSILLIALCFCLITFGGKPSPLSAYSSQWNYPMFEKANTAADVDYLNNDEKEFIYILNLARMNPFLFSETVLKPYAQKNGYTFPIVNMMDKLKYSRPANVLLPHPIFKNDLNNWIDSIKIYENSNPKLAFQKTALKNTVYLISPTTNMVDLFCKMIADTNAGVHSIRNLVLSPNNSISVSTKKGQYLITAVYFDERTPDQLQDYLNQKENDRIKEKIKNRKYISFFDCPEDSVLNYYIKDQKLDIKNAVFLSTTSFDSITKRLRDSGLNINIQEKAANIEISKSIPKKKNGSIKYSYFTWSYSNSNEFTGDYDTENPFHYFTFNRSIPDSIGEQINVIFKEIKTPPLIPPFHIDSIGVTPPEIDYDKVDHYSKSVGTFPIKQMAITLTKPWKTEAEKVRAIFKWMDYNIKYDYQGLETGKWTTEPVEVLTKKVAVCQGYSELFSALCDAIGIRNKLIVGVAKKSANDFPGHAWNAVCINKKWYLIDVTWGEGYYLKSPSYFYSDHFPNQNRWTLFPEFHSFKEFKTNN